MTEGTVFLFLVLIFIFSAVLHEVFHGLAADALGDPTPRLAGRITFNPLAHMDPVGSFLIPLFCIMMAKLTGGFIIFGWAKPVPINPLNFKNPKYDQAKVAFAGPLANLLLAFFCGILIRFFIKFLPSFEGFILFLALTLWVNLILAFFNLLPIPPLDGSHILFTFWRPSDEVMFFLHQYGFLLLLFFLFFGFDLLLKLVVFFFKILAGTSPGVFFR